MVNSLATVLLQNVGQTLINHGGKQSPKDIKTAMIILRDKLDSFIKSDTFTKTMIDTSLEVDDQKMNIDNDDDVDNKPTEPTYNTTVVASGHCPSTITGSVCGVEYITETNAKKKNIKNGKILEEDKPKIRKKSIPQLK